GRILPPAGTDRRLAARPARGRDPSGRQQAWLTLLVVRCPTEIWPRVSALRTLPDASTRNHVSQRWRALCSPSRDVIAVVKSSTLVGIDAVMIDVECTVQSRQLPQYNVVGLPAPSVKEGSVRIRSA